MSQDSGNLASRFHRVPKGGKLRDDPASRGTGPRRDFSGNVTRWIATECGVGYMPIAPATWGSLVVVIVCWFAVRAPRFEWPILIAAVVASVVGVWAADDAEKQLGHDAHAIVVDEIAGMLISLLWLPHTLQAVGLAFLFFRIFDIAKPEPANRAQLLGGGLGVMADDVVAGLYACLASHLALWGIAQLHHPR